MPRAFVAGLIEAAGRAEAGFVDGVCDAFGFWCGARGLFRLICGWAEGVFEAGYALGLGVLAGGDAQDAAESAEDGEATYAGGSGEVSEASAFGGVLGEVFCGGGNDGGLRVGTRSGEVGLAALAGAKASLLGCGGTGEESDVLARGPTAGATGAAVDFRRFDGIEELAVGAGVAGEDLLPLAAGEQAGDSGLGIRDGDGLRWFGAALVGHGVGSHIQYHAARGLAGHSAMFMDICRGYFWMSAGAAKERSSWTAARMAKRTVHSDQARVSFHVAKKKVKKIIAVAA